MLLEEIPFWMIKDFKPKPKDFTLKLYKRKLTPYKGKLYPVKIYAPPRLSFDRKLEGKKSCVALCRAGLENIRPECYPSLIKLLVKRIEQYKRKMQLEQEHLYQIFREEIMRRKNTPVDQGWELLFREWFSPL